MLPYYVYEYDVALDEERAAGPSQHLCTQLSTNREPLGPDIDGAKLVRVAEVAQKRSCTPNWKIVERKSEKQGKVKADFKPSNSAK